MLRSERKCSQGDSEPRVTEQLGTGQVLSEREWRERALSTAWVQVVPKTPLSPLWQRAYAHNTRYGLRKSA